MKKWSLLFVTVGSFYFVQAQSTADSAASTEKLPKPEFMNQLYYYNEAQNKTVALEKTEVTQKTKTKLGGFGGSNTNYIIEGEKSNIRFGQSDKIAFVIKMNSMAAMDPTQANTLRRFEISDKSRKSEMQKVGAMGTSPKMNVDGIKCVVKELKEGLYLITTEKPLTPGEYAFISMMTPASYNDPKNPRFGAFAFGIDP